MLDKMEHNQADADEKWDKVMESLDLLFVSVAEVN
jgi:hypothetical protein